jgi:L-amino acid N-acyltransferase YncA
MQIEIERAEAGDLPRIVEIYNQAILDGFSTADMETYQPEDKLQWFNSHDVHHPLYVLRSEGQVMGWISLSAYRPGRKALQSVREVSGYLDSQYRGRGLGTKLMQFVIDLAPSLGVDCLLGILLSRNNKSIALVEKTGFEKWGTLPGIADFNGERCDHLYYGKKLVK